MSQPPTTRLITAAAREVLRPMGLFQRGRSRTWLADQGWWLVVVEFQPSGFGMASYLNVAASWLWSERDSMAFDVGGRTRWTGAAGAEVGGISYESDDQFEREARRMVEAAAVQVELYRSLFITLEDCADYFSVRADVPVEQYPHAAVAHALVGRTPEAIHWFDRYLDYEDDREWAVARRADAQELKALLRHDIEAFRTEIRRRVAETRKRFKLPPLLEKL